MTSVFFNKWDIEFLLKCKVNTENDQVVQKHLFRLNFIKLIPQLPYSFHTKDEISESLVSDQHLYNDGNGKRKITPYNKEDRKKSTISYPQKGTDQSY